MCRAPLIIALLAAAICAIASGCGINDPEDYYCSLAKPDCPDGYECNGELCVKEGTIAPDTAQPDPDLGVDAPSPDPDGPVADVPQPDVAQPDVAQPDVMPDVASDVQPDVQTDVLPDGAGDGPQEDAVGDASADTIVVVCSSGEAEDCYTGSMSTLNQGTCQAGTRTCNDNGTWGPCLDEVLPVIPELCDGLDDDCDGTPDNACISCIDGETRDCGSDVGLCQTGTQYCTGGKWGSCNGAVGPEPEECDNSDHDCDGDAFNGMTCELGDTGGSCQTTCGTTGSEVCKANNDKCYWYCDPPAETCNGKDDDCDNQVDETFDCIKNKCLSCAPPSDCKFALGHKYCSSTCLEPKSCICGPCPLF